MVKLKSCEVLKTNTTKSWPYDQYYTGEIDAKHRRNGSGENNWTGAQSLECYSGSFTRNTMHGKGEYRWRFYKDEGVSNTYEGYFYNNAMHGFGPGIQSYAKKREDVGLWRGAQLCRLAWSPPTPSVIPDFISTPVARTFVETQRSLLIAIEKPIGESNSAIDLLKKCGANPKCAAEKWIKLYPKNCSDHNSPVCQTEVFIRNYYKGNCKLLEYKPQPSMQYHVQELFENNINEPNKETFYAWNNSVEIINMLIHSFKHEHQRNNDEVDIYYILSGSRNQYRKAGTHEINSRTLLMTSYLGYVSNVADLVNYNNVCPDVTDSQGNSALMYATCGDEVHIIRFLIEAGANVNSFNDSCCTPLGIALIRFICASIDISDNLMLQSLLPPPVVPPLEPRALDWNINRELGSQNVAGSFYKSSSKTRNLSTKKIKSLLSIKDPKGSKKSENPSKMPDRVSDSDDSLSEDNDIYNDAFKEYMIRVNDLLIAPTPGAIASYIFQVNDMVKEIELIDDEPKKGASDKVPKKVMSKIIKDTVKTSKDVMWTSKEQIENISMSSSEKLRLAILNKIRETISELLSKGADPQLVRCPHSALFMAILSNSPDLISELVEHGANVNEVYAQSLNYTPLDIAISREFTLDSLSVIKTLLECGANTDRRLPCENNTSATDEIPIPGPTLLHAVIVRKVETDVGEEIRRQILDLLLEYDCSPTAQFRGRSAIDLAMSKSMELFYVFIKSPKINLNCVINELNQSVLAKMFWLPFFKSIDSNEKTQALTNLLLHGADPLLPCQNGNETFDNIFVFANKTLVELEQSQGKPNSAASAAAAKSKKPEKPKKEEKVTIVSKTTDDKEDFKQGIELVKECARLLHIRWIQGRLVKDLISTIDKYKHRHWNIILNEWKKKKCVGLWITPLRCLEIWNILGTTGKKIYRDRTILKHLLCIVTFLAWRFFDPDKKDFNLGSKVTAVVKGLIEKDVRYLLNEYNASRNVMEDFIWKRSYVKPEIIGANKKFNVCFECALPLEKDRIVCVVCKLVSFCSLDCMRINIDRATGHPCSQDLCKRYFPAEKSSLVEILLP